MNYFEDAKQAVYRWREWLLELLLGRDVCSECLLPTCDTCGACHIAGCENYEVPN